MATPLSAHNWSAWLRRAPIFGQLARAIGRREGWPNDAWAWTALQRGQARSEIMARLDVTVFTIPRATNDGGPLATTLSEVRGDGRVSSAP